MDFFFGLVCATFFSLANARTATTLTPTAYPLYPEFDNCGFNLKATCDDKMKLFADGELLATSKDWKKTSVVYIPANTGEIEIRCIDGWILGGILASSENGLITNNAWNCSSDNGTTWNNAHELGANGVTSEDISPDAKWIWTDRPTWTHTKQKRHTTAICTIQLSNKCGTTPTPTPPCTECVPCLFSGTTPTPTLTPTTTPTPTPTTTEPTPGFSLNATCNNKMELFVDGNLRATSYSWRDTSQVHIAARTQTIEIHCSDSCWLIEGILASSDNGLITDNSWNCSSDNGITWSSAHAIVPNGLSVPDISPDAKWISTGQNTWMDGGKVICKVMLDVSAATMTTTKGYRVSGIPTRQVTANLGSTIWIDRPQYSITIMPQELVGSTLFQPASHYVDISTIEVFSPHEAIIYVGVYEARDGGLMEILPTQGWTLRNGWFVEWNRGAGERLQKIWSKQIDAGKTISFTTSKNGITFAIFISEGCLYTDKYVECPEFKNQCKTGNFVDCMNRECAKTCKCGPQFGDWSPWSSWSSCSSTCGIAAKTRTRTCPELPCRPGITEETASCHLPSCDSIYFIAGGIGALRDIELYHPTMANLSCSMSPPPLNNKWWYHTTFYYNNTIHLYGGYDTASTCISYNINTEEWKTHTLSTSRWYGHSSVVLKERVFIIGGKDTSNNYVGAESTPLLLTDQPVLTPVPNLYYKGYFQCTTKVDEDTLVVTGGHFNGFSSSVIEYNAKTRTTTSLPSMKQQRYQHGCAVVEMDNTNWIIVAGGYNRADGYLETTEMLQMGKTSWKPLGNLNVARRGHSIAETQRGVMAMGGRSASRYLSSVELLDWSAKSWRIVQPSLRKPRGYFGGAVEIPASMFDCRGRQQGQRNFPRKRLQNFLKLPELEGSNIPTLPKEPEQERSNISSSQKQPEQKLSVLSLPENLQETSKIPSLHKKSLPGQLDEEDLGILSLPGQQNIEAPKLQSLTEQSGMKLEFQLKGKIGIEKVKISVDGNEEEIGLTTEWRLFSYPRPSTGSFSVEFLNDIGYTDVFIRGHESQVTDLLPNFPTNKFLGCGTENEDEKCGYLREGTLMWNGKYTYTLKDRSGLPTK